MVDNVKVKQSGNGSNSFWLALGLNIVWVQFSEAVRFFGLIKPMLNETFPGQSHIAALTPFTSISWIIWVTVLLIAATGFFWIYLNYLGATIRNVFISSIAFTLTVFGLFWLGAVNMGFVPMKFIWVALPFAWLELVISAYIVLWVIKRQR